jgi:hypothetical protein
MRVTAMSLLAVWIILNAVLAFVARVKPLVSAVFAGAAITMAAGLALRSPALADVGLAASLVGPVLYGALVMGRNHLSHHLVLVAVKEPGNPRLRVRVLNRRSDSLSRRTWTGRARTAAPALARREC